MIHIDLLQHIYYSRINMTRAIQSPQRTTCQPYGRQQHFLVQFCVCQSMHSFDRRKETHLYVCCGREDLRIDQPNCIEQRTKSFVSWSYFIADIFNKNLNKMRNLSWGIPLACVLILVVLWTTQQAFLNQDQVRMLMIEDGGHIYGPILLNKLLLIIFFMPVS